MEEGHMGVGCIIGSSVLYVMLCVCMCVQWNP